MVPFWGDLSQNEKLSEIKPPLLKHRNWWDRVKPCFVQYVRPKGRSKTTLTSFLAFFDIFYLINVDKKLTFMDYLPPFSCKRRLWTTPYNTFLSNLSGNQTDWKQKLLDCLKMRIFQNPFCQLFFRWVLYCRIVIL